MLSISNHQSLVDQLSGFIKSTYDAQRMTNAVIAISGGIDSALSLALLAKVLPKQNIYPLFLPYNNQSLEDSRKITKWAQIPQDNIKIINIFKPVNEISKLLEIKDIEQQEQRLRMGNVMARTRMIIIYDMAKQKQALVCGTENKSEKYLGYFTRFGDEASDIEPLIDLYKTQVRELAQYLNLPDIFLTKDPSAGLWNGQTDEKEFGFSYHQADQVLSRLEKNYAHLLKTGQFKVDQLATKLSFDNIDIETVKKILARVKSVAFKHQVPYTRT